MYTSIHPSIDFFLVALIRIYPSKFFRSSSTQNRSQLLKKSSRIDPNLDQTASQIAPKLIPNRLQVEPCQKNLPKMTPGPPRSDF